MDSQNLFRTPDQLTTNFSSDWHKRPTLQHLVFKELTACDTFSRVSRTYPLLQSRATDEKGNVQTTRDKWAEQYSVGNVYHYNAMQTWSISPEGEITNVYL